MRFSRQQYVALFCGVAGNLFSGMILSLQAPFYPKEAEKKGLSPSEYGLVMGIYQLVVAFSSPIFGHFINRLGINYSYKISTAFLGTFSILFGFLDRVDNQTFFFVFSLLIRILEGLGEAVFAISGATILLHAFPESRTMILSWSETMLTTGYVIGPPLGGFLYSIGGFTLPFVVVGLMIYCCSILGCYGLNDDCQKDTEESSISVITTPQMWIGLVSTLTIASLLGYYDSTLEPFLRTSFHISVMEVSSVFLLSALICAITTPLCGWLCEKWLPARVFTLISAVIAICGLILSGPSPLISQTPSLWVTIVGIIMVSAGQAGAAFGGLFDCLNVAEQNGQKHTESIIYGFYKFMFDFGNFSGLFAGGVLYESFGFPWGASMFALVVTVLVVILLMSVNLKPSTSYQELKQHTFTLEE